MLKPLHLSLSSQNTIKHEQILNLYSNKIIPLNKCLHKITAGIRMVIYHANGKIISEYLFSTSSFQFTLGSELIRKNHFNIQEYERNRNANYVNSIYQSIYKKYIYFHM